MNNKLINGHKFQQYETKNTVQFSLCNSKGRILLQHSVQKHLSTEGYRTFWSRVDKLYTTIAQKKQLDTLIKNRRKELSVSRFLTAVTFEQGNLRGDLDKQGHTDFLEKIKRVILPV